VELASGPRLRRAYGSAAIPIDRVVSIAVMAVMDSVTARRHIVHGAAAVAMEAVACNGGTRMAAQSTIPVLLSERSA